MVHLLLQSLGSLQQHFMLQFQEVGLRLLMEIAIFIQLCQLFLGASIILYLSRQGMKLVIKPLHSNMSPSWPALFFSIPSCCFYSILLCSMPLFFSRETLIKGITAVGERGGTIGWWIVLVTSVDIHVSCCWNGLAHWENKERKELQMEGWFVTPQCTFSRWWLRTEIPKGEGWLHASVWYALFALMPGRQMLWNLCNELLFDDPLGGLEEKNGHRCTWTHGLMTRM